MNKNIFTFICLFLIDQTILLSANRETFYLPMKKNHKYGDDICLYREDIDEKREYTIYYVKPCEKGKYCENEINRLGFCRDIPTNATDFPTYEGDCKSNGECLKGLDCNNGKCNKITQQCPSYDPNHPDFPFFDELNHFECLAYNDKTTDDGKHYRIYDYNKMTSDPLIYNTYPIITYGKYPGLPKENGAIVFTSVTDNYIDISETGTPHKSFERWLKKSEDWCTIGEIEDGEFVSNWRFCKSGFTLKFYPNKDLVDPSVSKASYNENLYEMCVTPIQIDMNNPEINGPLITYKIKDGNEQKYNYYKYYTQGASDDFLEENSVIQSKLYTEFIEEFQNASDEDKKNCYRIPRGNPGDEGNCQNIKLLKLYYFYNKINEYFFYKDRKDLEKVLHYNIQKVYHRYYDLSTYFKPNYLFLLLILLLL